MINTGTLEGTPVMCRLVSAATLLLAGPTLAQAAFTGFQNELSMILSSEPCELSYKQDTIQLCVETRVRNDNLEFTSMLPVLVSWGGFRGVGCLEGQIPDPSCGRETQES